MAVLFGLDRTFIDPQSQWPSPKIAQKGQKWPKLAKNSPRKSGSYNVVYKSSKPNITFKILLPTSSGTPSTEV